MGAVTAARPFRFCGRCAPHVPAVVEEILAARVGAPETAALLRGPAVPVMPPADLGRMWRTLTQLWRLAHTETISTIYDNESHRAKAAEWWVWLAKHCDNAEKMLDFTARPRARRKNHGKTEVTIHPRGE